MYRFKSDQTVEGKRCGKGWEFSADEFAPETITKLLLYGMIEEIQASAPPEDSAQKPKRKAGR